MRHPLIAITMLAWASTLCADEATALAALRKIGGVFVREAEKPEKGWVISVTGLPEEGSLEDLKEVKNLRRLVVTPQATGKKAILLGVHRIRKADWQAILSELKGLSEIHSIQFRRAQFCSLQGISGLDAVEELSLSVPYIELEYIAELKKMKSLKSLSITLDFDDARYFDDARSPGDVKHLDDVVRDVAGVPALISLGSDKLTDAHLKHLKAAKNLSSLSVNANKVTAAGIPQLSVLKSLRELTFDASTLPAHLPTSAIGRLTGLTSLRIGGLSDSGLKDIVKIGGLEELIVNQSKISDAGVKELKNLPKLKTLYLRAFVETLTDKGAKEIGNLESLRSLDVERTKIGDAGLKELKKLPQLTRLKLGSNISDDGVKHLKAMSNLEVLDLGKALLTHAALEDLKALKKLKWLYIPASSIPGSIPRGFYPREKIDELQKALPECKIRQRTVSSLDPAFLLLWR